MVRRMGGVELGFTIKRRTDTLTLNELARSCYQRSYDAGWWHNPHTGQQEPMDTAVAQKLLLIHSEVAEATEGYRRDLMDDKLPHRPMIEVELADAIIRICDLAGGLGLDLEGAIREKQEYNNQRSDHKLESRQSTGGKRF